MSYLSKRTGRPKEQGGHNRHNISMEKFVSEALKKVRNKSKFIESVVKPALEKLDPGEACVFIWEFDVYIKQLIINAAKDGNFELVQTLGWIADQLEDPRRLCGKPQLHKHLEKLRYASSPRLSENPENLWQGGRQKASCQFKVDADVVRRVLIFISENWQGCSLISIQAHMLRFGDINFMKTAEAVNYLALAGFVQRDRWGRYYITAPLDDIAKHLERLEHERTKPSHLPLPKISSARAPSVTTYIGITNHCFLDSAKALLT